MKAKSQWYNSPANGYMKLVRQRQSIDDNNNVIVVNQKTYQLKDTQFEGDRLRFVWTDFAPTTSVAQNGYWTRSVFVLQWKKDDAARDTVVKTKSWATAWCQQPE